jgi:hypothetical protein
MPAAWAALATARVDSALGDALAVLDEEVGAAEAGGPRCEPGVEQFFELGVQRYVAVRAEFADRHVKPVGGADLHDRVDGKVQELALAEAGAGQELHGQTHERVGVSTSGLQQLGERAVVEEAGQWRVAQWQVAVEDEHGDGDVVTVPLDETLEAGAQSADVFGQTRLGERATAGGGSSGEVQLVGLDVVAAKVSDTGDLRGVGGEPGGELAQHAFDTHHRRCSQRQPDLGDVAQERRGQPRRDRCPLGGSFARVVAVGLAGRRVEHAEVEQGGLRAEQRRAQRFGTVAVGSVTADGGDQRLSPLVDHSLRRLLGAQPGQRRHLDQRGPLQAADSAVEAELGRGGDEPFVEGPMMVSGDLTEIGATRDQIVGTGPQPARHHQPSHHPAILERQVALGCERQSGPSIGSDPGEEHAGNRRHGMVGEHAGLDKVRSIRGDKIFDIGAPCRRSAHRVGPWAVGAVWASIASAARRYSFSNQSLARCR